MDEKQRIITRMIIQAGQMLLAHGAESTLVGDLIRRLGLASGMTDVEVSMSASSLVVTTVMNEHCITTARRCFPNRGINMKVVTEVRILHYARSEKLLITPISAAINTSG